LCCHFNILNNHLLLLLLSNQTLSVQEGSVDINKMFDPRPFILKLVSLAKGSQFSNMFSKNISSEKSKSLTEKVE
jgi:hypothetical protein